MIIKSYLEKQYSKLLTVSLVLLTSLLGMAIGINFTLTTANLLVLLLLWGTGLPLTLMLLYPHVQYFLRLSQYQKNKRSLIQS